MKKRVLEFVKTNKIIILKSFLILMISLIIYNFGRLYELKKFENNYNKLTEKYQSLLEEYQDYKEHSYILLG